MLSESRKAIYVDEETYEKILKHSEAFKSPGHFVKFIFEMWEIKHER